MARLIAMQAYECSTSAITAKMTNLAVIEAVPSLPMKNPLVRPPVLVTIASDLTASRSRIKNLGILRLSYYYCACSNLRFVQSCNSISRYRALLIISSMVLQLDMHTNYRILSLSMSWYLVILISSSTAYRGTDNALSRNFVVISAIVFVVWRRTWNSLAYCCTLITGEN